MLAAKPWASSARAAHLLRGSREAASRHLQPADRADRARRGGPDLPPGPAGVHAFVLGPAPAGGPARRGRISRVPVRLLWDRGLGRFRRRGGSRPVALRHRGGPRGAQGRLRRSPSVRGRLSPGGYPGCAGQGTGPGPRVVGSGRQWARVLPGATSDARATVRPHLSPTQAPVAGSGARDPGTPAASPGTGRPERAAAGAATRLHRRTGTGRRLGEPPAPIRSWPIGSWSPGSRRCSSTSPTPPRPTHPSCS